MHGSSLVTTEEIICVTPRPTDPVLDRLESWALERDLTVTRRSFEAPPLSYREERTIGLAVGGDGTFLEAVKLFAPQTIPVAGVKRGTLSFLCRIPPEDITAAVREMLRGEAAIAPRQRYQVSGAGFDASGINDITIQPPLSGDQRSCRIQAFVDDEYIGAYSGGGLAVSTPIGSTAMALSAGGPIVHPANNRTLLLIDLMHDTLGVRPLVFDASRSIRLVSETNARVLVDGGRAETSLSPGDQLTVTGASPAQFVHTRQETPYMATLANKLAWGLREATPPAFTSQFRDSVRGEFTTRRSQMSNRTGRLSIRGPGSTGRRDTGKRDDHSLTGYRSTETEDPAEIWRQLRSERPPRIRSRGQQKRWTMFDERPDWLRQRLETEHQEWVDDHQSARRTACEAVVAAGELAHRYYRRMHTDSSLSNDTLLHRAKTDCERILATVLGNAYPDYAIYAGSSELQSGTSEYTWLLDPIDGETNFEHGNPSYCSTLALLKNEKPVVGVVYAPAAEELFHAIAGGEAYRNSGRIEPTDRDSLDESMLLSGYDPDGAFLQQFYSHTRGVRRLGSQALNLTYVAAGSADGLWEFDTYPWDIAAGICILRAAGGTITTPEGSPFSIQGGERERAPLLASNGPLHPALLELLSESIQ